MGMVHQDLPDDRFILFRIRMYIYLNIFIAPAQKTYSLSKNHVVLPGGPVSPASPLSPFLPLFPRSPLNIEEV